MAIIGPGRRELAELVTNHVLGDQHRDMLLTIVDAEGQANKILITSARVEDRAFSAFFRR
eukprot:gene20307-20895_t